MLLVEVLDPRGIGTSGRRIGFAGLEEAHGQHLIDTVGRRQNEMVPVMISSLLLNKGAFSRRLLAARLGRPALQNTPDKGSDETWNQMSVQTACSAWLGFDILGAAYVKCPWVAQQEGVFHHDAHTDFL